jgi:hypothetical protein
MIYAVSKLMMCFFGNDKNTEEVSIKTAAATTPGQTSLLSIKGTSIIFCISFR